MDSAKHLWEMQVDDPSGLTCPHTSWILQWAPSLLWQEVLLLPSPQIWFIACRSLWLQPSHLCPLVPWWVLQHRYLPQLIAWHFQVCVASGSLFVCVPGLGLCCYALNHWFLLQVLLLLVSRSWWQHSTPGVSPSLSKSNVCLCRGWCEY